MSAAGTGSISELVRAAWDDAERAAEAADIQVHAATRADVPGIRDVLGSVWGAGQRLQPNLLMAMAHAGGTVGSAVREGTAVGACVGFLGWEGGVHLHSHMVAVRTDARTVGVGYALKLWQRAMCLDRGVAEIRWTYDPLVRRNAYFNLVKLGATVLDYCPDFYGEMDDAVNAGDRSDRFEVSWRLDGVPPGAARPRAPMPTGGLEKFVALPEDYDTMRLEFPAEARRVRQEAGAAIAEHWAAGLRPVWSARGGYLFQGGELGRG